ncbi:MAG: peroxidase-related enzyme [Pseudomonadota bacterium]
MSERNAWIEIIEPPVAGGRLKELYDVVKTPHGTVDNVMKVHSLRPETMHGHVVLYRSILHHEDVEQPLAFLECVAAYVSMLNGCEYSLTHHFMNARRLMADDARADAVYAAFEARAPEREFGGKELGLLRYAAKLTTAPGDMAEADLAEAREGGASDADILEVNQVCAYFNYSNRLLNGLGVTLAGDTIGYYSE